MVDNDEKRVSEIIEKYCRINPEKSIGEVISDEPVCYGNSVRLFLSCVVTVGDLRIMMNKYKNRNPLG